MSAQTPDIDISPEQWAIVQSILQEHVPDLAVWAFGSRVKGTAKPYSDLDIAIITDQPLPLQKMAALRDAFSESDLPWKVDVVDWAATSLSFRKIIERERVVVQRAQAADKRNATMTTNLKEQGYRAKWPTVRLGDYVNASLGKMLDAKKNKGLPCPYLGNSNVRWGSFQLNDLELMKFEEGEEERYGVRDGDLIVCEGGEPGRCAVWKEQIPNMKIQKALHRIRPKNGLNNYYLFYWFMLAGRTGALEPFFTGTTIKHLTGKALNELQVMLPPLAEQRAIARILGTLDDKIELNRKQNETLEAMARALFKAWFVDFEPVRAKMEGRWQRGQSLPGLPAHLYDLFPDRLVESELGEIPEGWREGALGDVAMQSRRSVRPSEIKEGTPYIALEHMPRRCIALAEWELANGLESNKCEFQRGDILFGKLRPYFHKVGVAPIAGVCSTDIVVIAPKLPMWFGFVLAHVSSDTFVEHTNAGSTGTKMPRYEVVLPNEGVAVAFNKHLQAVSKDIITKIHESKSLANLRDVLLPKLISGELRIPDAQRIVSSMV